MRDLVVILLPVLLLSTISVAQQAPFYTTQKFDSSQNHRTDLCDRQALLFNGNLSLSQALKGLSLSVVLTNYTSEGSKPFFTLNENGVIDPKNPGLFAIILDKLSERAGFFWRKSFGVVLPVDSATDGNKTWSDLLKWEVETYDISAGKWDRSVARLSQEIAFPEGWFDSSMILVSIDSHASSQEQLNIWSFLLPFQWTVWLLLALAVVVTGVSYWFLERLDTSSDDRSMEDHPGDAVFYTAITFTGHFEFRPQTSAAMILTFSTTFIALIIGAVYTANLASFLVARRIPTHSIESVEQAVLMRAPICVQAKVNIDDYLTEKYPEAVLVRREKKEDIFSSLENGECSVAVMAVSEYEQYSRDTNVNGDCTLQWNGRVEQIIPAGFASDVDSGTLCSSLISHVLDLHFIQLKADGFLEREWEAHLQRTGTQNCVENVESASSNEEDTFSLGVQEMAGIFIIHAILLALALLVALVHYCRVRNIAKREGAQDGDMEMAAGPVSKAGAHIDDGTKERQTTSLTSRTVVSEEEEDSSSQGLGGVSSKSIMGGSFRQV